MKSKRASIIEADQRDVRQITLLEKLKYKSSILEEFIQKNSDLVLVSNLSADLKSC